MRSARMRPHLRFFTLLRYDLRGIVREPALLLQAAAMFLIPLIIAVVPSRVADLLSIITGKSSIEIVHLVNGFLIQVSPMLAGLLASNVHLEEKEEEILKNYRVTDLGLQGYEIYRIFSLMPFLFVSGMAGLLLTGITVVNAVFWIFPLLMEGILIYIFVIRFAGDRMQGLAMGKVAGGFVFLGALGRGVGDPYNIPFFVLPSFWIAGSPSLASAGRVENTAWSLMAMGLAFLFFLLFRRREKKFQN